MGCIHYNTTMSSFNSDNMLNSVVSKFPKHTKFAVLKLAIDSDELPENIWDLYKSHIQTHNKQMVNNPYSNAGFDLFIPQNVNFDNAFEVTFLNHKVRAEMVYYDPTYGWEPSAYYLAPRSSISKTPFMMANSTGIIDSGYRGDLIGAVRYFPSAAASTYILDAKTRLFQICHPTLCPVYVVVVNRNELSETARGEGGFGSTGV